MIVLDSSAVLSVLLDEEHGDAVEGLMAGHTTLCAPALLAYEVTNILSLHRRRTGDGALSDGALTQFSEWPWVFEAHCTLASLQAVARLCASHGLTAYDASYLELAQRRACPLVTFDQPLRRAAREQGIVVLPE